MTDAYFIRFRGQVQGPFSADRLRELARRGAFGRSHEVSEDGRQWRRATDYPQLFPQPSAPVERRRSHDHVETKTSQAAAGQPPGEYSLTMAPGVTVQDRAPDAGGARSETWYFTDGTREVGPVSLDDLRSLAAQGRLLATDLVWTEGMEQWCEAARVSSLEFASSAAATPAGAEELGRTPGLAVASLICGLLGISILPGIGSLLAVVFGHLAMSRIKRRGASSQRGMGLAMTGVSLGYVALIVILVVLIAAIFWLLLGPQPAPPGNVVE